MKQKEILKINIDIGETKILDIGLGRPTNTLKKLLLII